MNGSPRSAALVAITAGLVGALLIDAYLCLTEGLVVRGVTPQLVMQWDASNLLGMAAYRGGWTTAAFGTLLHVMVSIAWAFGFVAMASRARWLTAHPYLSGTLLGIVAMAVMRAVIHLGHAVIRPFPSVWYFAYILIGHVLFFGIPVALVVTRLSQRSERAVGRG